MNDLVLVMDIDNDLTPVRDIAEVKLMAESFLVNWRPGPSIRCTSMAAPMICFVRSSAIMLFLCVLGDLCG